MFPSIQPRHGQAPITHPAFPPLDGYRASASSGITLSSSAGDHKAPAPAATPSSHSTPATLPLPGIQGAQVTLAITVELSAGGPQARASCPAPADTSSARGHQDAPLIARHALPESTGANRLSASSITPMIDSDGLGALHLRQRSSQPAVVVSRDPIGSNQPAVSGASQDIDVSYGTTRSSFPCRTQMVSSARFTVAASSPHLHVYVIANYMFLHSMPPTQFCQGQIPACSTRPPRLPGRLLMFFSPHLRDHLLPIFSPRLLDRLLVFFSPHLLGHLLPIFSPHLPDNLRSGTRLEAVSPWLALRSPTQITPIVPATTIHYPDMTTT